MLDPRTDLSSHHFRIFNPSSGQANDLNFSHIARKPAQNYERTIQFRAGNMEDEESGVCSPPLWKASSPPHRSYPHNNYKNLSPNSKAQAIARGQWELMEMAKNMPESCYELSLKDIVELPRLQPQEGDCLAGERFFGGNQLRGKVIKKNEKKALMGRSRSVDSTGGLLLKMAFPFSLGSRKKNKLGTVTNSCWAVSAARSDQALDGSSKGGVGREYWWKKRFYGWSDGEFGATTSSNSGSSRSSSRSNSNCSTRKRNGSCYPGCWSLLSTKSKGRL